jgi:hypothetical protein
MDFSHLPNNELQSLYTSTFGRIKGYLTIARGASERSRWAEGARYYEKAREQIDTLDWIEVALRSRGLPTLTESEKADNGLLQQAYQRTN